MQHACKLLQLSLKASWRWLRLSRLSRAGIHTKTELKYKSFFHLFNILVTRRWLFWSSSQMRLGLSMMGDDGLSEACNTTCCNCIICYPKIKSEEGKWKEWWPSVSHVEIEAMCVCVCVSSLMDSQSWASRADESKSLSWTH